MKHLNLLFLGLLLCMIGKASTGDTTWIVVNNLDSLTHYGAYDYTAAFPHGNVQYRKIYAIFTIGEYNCPSGTQYCHQWDYDVENYILSPLGDTLELARFITPYATSGHTRFRRYVEAALYL